MSRVGPFALIAALFVLAGGLTGQEPKVTKKEEPPPVRYKGVLPSNWKKLGLTDEQVQDVYKIQNKYGTEIDKLEAKIKELKTTRDKEAKAILTTEQKKRLEDILLGKDN